MVPKFYTEYLAYQTASLRDFVRIGAARIPEIPLYLVIEARYVCILDAHGEPNLI